MGVQDAINAGYASGLIYNYQGNADAQIDQIRIAFDGDAVLFSDESERIYQTGGIEAFVRYEKENARKALPAGPFSKLLKTLSILQQVAGPGNALIRTALVTARNSPAHERVIRTLREWKVRIDEAFFWAAWPNMKFYVLSIPTFSSMINLSIVSRLRTWFQQPGCFTGRTTRRAQMWRALVTIARLSKSGIFVHHRCCFNFGALSLKKQPCGEIFKELRDLCP